MTPILVCPEEVVSQTLRRLKSAGRRHNECIVLWLGRRSVGRIDVVEAYRPSQRARCDQFLIPPGAMASLRHRLRDRHLMVAAQVHSHPAEAFHSMADDAGAIIRHVGALSFVIPWFARQTTATSFLDDVALFEHHAGNRWLEVPPDLVRAKCQITR